MTLGTAAGLVLAATEGVDYVSVDGDTVTITGTADGVSSTTFTVETTDDYLADTGEQYIVEISDPTGTGLGSTVRHSHRQRHGDDDDCRSDRT